MTNDMHIDTCSLHTFVTTSFLMGGGDYHSIKIPKQTLQLILKDSYLKKKDIEDFLTIGVS